METDVGILQNSALKITFLYQTTSELRFTNFPKLWKTGGIFPNSTGTGVPVYLVPTVSCPRGHFTLG